MKLLVTVIVIVAALFVLGWSRRWREHRVHTRALYPPPGQGTDEDVERFIVLGRKMTAIKLYREIHGVDLKSAKEAVETMSRERRSGR